MSQSGQTEVRERWLQVRMLILMIVLVVAGCAAVALGIATRSSDAGPQPCPGTDPTSCPMYGDSRDNWVFDRSWGLNGAEGDKLLVQEGPSTAPMSREYVCSNHVDDDGDGRADYPSDIGCTDSQDMDEYNAPPPAPPPPPPPPPAPPPPPEDPLDTTEKHSQITFHDPPGGSPGAHYETCISDLWSGVDMQRIRETGEYAFFGSHEITCDDAMSWIKSSLCILRQQVPAGAWFPAACVTRQTMANFRQFMFYSRRCHLTQNTRFNWRAEILVQVRDLQGVTAGGVHRTPVTPSTLRGMLCY